MMQWVKTVLRTQLEKLNYCREIICSCNNNATLIKLNFFNAKL